MSERTEAIATVRNRAMTMGHIDKWLFIALCDALLAEKAEPAGAARTAIGDVVTVPASDNWGSGS